MVAMPVGHDEMIDLLKPGVFDGVHDAAGVTYSGSSISGVDEQGLMRGRHKQNRVAALDIDDVDIQRLGRLRHGKGGSEKTGKNCYTHVNRVYRNLCHRGDERQPGPWSIYVYTRFVQARAKGEREQFILLERRTH